SLIGLGVTQSYQWNKTAEEAQMHSADITLLQATLDSLLKNEDSCRRALGGPVFYGGPVNNVIAQIFQPDGADWPVRIYRPDNSVLFDSGTRFGKLTIAAISLRWLENLGAVPGLGNAYYVQMIITADTPTQT